MSDLQADDENFRVLFDGLAALPSELKSPRSRSKKAPRGENWALAERLFVEGEVVGEGASATRSYKSRSDIARATGQTIDAIDQRARRYKWVEKRKQFQSANGIIPPVGSVGTAYKQALKSGKASKDVRATVVAYIELFSQAVAEGTLRHDTVADLERAVRLLAFIDGRAESIRATHVTVSLDIMQARHKALRAQVQAGVDDEVAGVLGQGIPDAEVLEESSELEAARVRGGRELE